MGIYSSPFTVNICFYIAHVCHLSSYMYLLWFPLSKRTKSSCKIQVPLHNFPSHPIIILILKETAGSNLVLHSIQPTSTSTSTSNLVGKNLQPKLHLAYYNTFPFSVYSDGADDYVMSPYLGNVCFASSEYRFCFTLYSFASLYVDTFGELCLSLFDFQYWTP